MGYTLNQPPSTTGHGNTRFPYEQLAPGDSFDIDLTLNLLPAHRRCPSYTVEIENLGDRLRTTRKT